MKRVYKGGHEKKKYRDKKLLLEIGSNPNQTKINFPSDVKKSKCKIYYITR